MRTFIVLLGWWFAVQNYGATFTPERWDFFGPMSSKEECERIRAAVDERRHTRRQTIGCWYDETDKGRKRVAL